MRIKQSGGREFDKIDYEDVLLKEEAWLLEDDDDDYWYYEDDRPEDYPDWDGDESMMYYLDHYVDKDDEEFNICPECSKDKQGNQNDFDEDNELFESIMELF